MPKLSEQDKNKEAKKMWYIRTKKGKITVLTKITK